MRLDKASALRDGLTVAVDLAYAPRAWCGLDEQVVVDLEAQRAHDMEVELGEQVVDGVDRAGGGVLDGSTPNSQKPSRTARMTPSKVSKNAMSGTSKSLHAAIWL